MDSSEKFNSLTDLYIRITPALKTKVTELKRINFNNINEIDIWNYCITNLWKNKTDLRMYKLVDDILNVDEIKLSIFVKNNKMNRNDQNER